MKIFSVPLALLLVSAGFCSTLAFTPHEKIMIASDADFTPENGVIGGSGTPEDPYVIAGWEIDAGAGTGIVIRDTGKSFVIEDCRIAGKPTGTGISLVETRGGKVHGCELVGLGVGIFVYRSEKAVLEGNTFVGCRRGVDGSESPGLIIRGNAFHDTVKESVFLWHCHDGLVVGNRFQNGGTAVYLDSCHRDRLRGNMAVDVGWGLFLWDSFDCVITENLLWRCQLGVALVHTSSGNVVYHNAFLECERAAACDGPGNRWDNGYPAGGNYWGTVGLEDRFSGPEQKRGGSDGIGDRPVEIPLACVDRYPLMQLPQGIPELKEGG